MLFVTNVFAPLAQTQHRGVARIVHGTPCESDDQEFHEQTIRDLQIVFSPPGGFKEKLFLSGFFPARSAGGFHYPIGEECCSGVSISGDTLIVGLFMGSAWKSRTRDYYRYSTADDAFF